MGQTFYVDPDGFEKENLFKPYYIESNVNTDMNNPGIRYYQLWDDNANINGIPNRVGKVWPDLKMITFDDDEIIASLSYKSNRNWTLPAPETGLIVPNIITSSLGDGLLDNSNEYLYVTYRFTNNLSFTNSSPVADLGWAAQISAAEGMPVDLPLDEERAREFFKKEN